MSPTSQSSQVVGNHLIRVRARAGNPQGQGDPRYLQRGTGYAQGGTGYAQGGMGGNQPYLPFRDGETSYRQKVTYRPSNPQGEALEEGGSPEVPGDYGVEIKKVTSQEVEVRTRAVMQKVGFSPSVTFAARAG